MRAMLDDVKHFTFSIPSLQNKQPTSGVLSNETHAEHINFISFNFTKVLAGSIDAYLKNGLHRALFCVTINNIHTSKWSRELVSILPFNYYMLILEHQNMLLNWPRSFLKIIDFIVPYWRFTIGQYTMIDEHWYALLYVATTIIYQCILGTYTSCIVVNFKWCPEQLTGLSLILCFINERHITQWDANFLLTTFFLLICTVISQVDHQK